MASDNKYQGKYRIPSARAQWWDYGDNAAYFITICTKHRINYFGNVVSKKMELSQVGVIADILWHEIINHSRNMKLGEFVVMPNHIHGILIIDEDKKYCGGDENGDCVDSVETRHALSLQTQTQTQTTQNTPGNRRFRNPGANTISSIIGGYKSAVTKHSNRLGYPFVWQTRFYDHIIRDNDEYMRIAGYINNNPAMWEEDKFFV